MAMSKGYICDGDEYDDGMIMSAKANHRTETWKCPGCPDLGLGGIARSDPILENGIARNGPALGVWIRPR